MPEQSDRTGAPPIGAASSDQPQARRPAWWRVLTAPILDVVRPRAAARCLLGASRTGFAVLALLSLLVYAGALIGLMLWAGTVQSTWVTPATLPTTTSATAPTTFPFWGATEVEERTIGEVWRQWRESSFDGWLGPAEVTVLCVLALGTAGLVILAWISLPFVHATGSAWSSYKRSLRASTAILWPLTLLTLASGAIVIRVLHAEYRSGAPLAMIAQVVVLPCIGISQCVLILWLSRAIGVAAPTAPSPALPPRCEGCGYDLTHQPDSGRCPECGADIRLSLCEDLARPGVPWQQAKRTETWRRTTIQVLFRPGHFYLALKLRAGSDADAGFAGWQFVTLALTAWVWAIALFVIDNLRYASTSDWPYVLVAISSLVLISTWTCWMGHRVLAAILVTLWLLAGALPDGRWARKVVVYETAYLWAFGIFWGALATSLMLFESWISRAVGLGRWWGGELEFLVFAGGTAALLVHWVARYVAAFRAIRWSNY